MAVALSWHLRILQGTFPGLGKYLGGTVQGGRNFQRNVWEMAGEVCQGNFLG